VSAFAFSWLSSLSLNSPVLFIYHLFNFSRSFLDDLYRIAQRGYEPTDDDVVRARLRTMGVQEHRFLFETGEHTLPPYPFSQSVRGQGYTNFSILRARGRTRMDFLRRRRVAYAREHLSHIDRITSGLESFVCPRS
jgi:hypothetical protein